MRLKTIKLAGFKSFVDPTSIHFVSNLTSVLGPNGCGKSNVIDAVRWVMGGIFGEKFAQRCANRRYFYGISDA
jgi:chromosome segregation ATPase